MFCFRFSRLGVRSVIYKFLKRFLCWVGENSIVFLCFNQLNISILRIILRKCGLVDVGVLDILIEKSILLVGVFCLCLVQIWMTKK